MSDGLSLLSLNPVIAQLFSEAANAKEYDAIRTQAADSQRNMEEAAMRAFMEAQDLNAQPAPEAGVPDILREGFARVADAAGGGNRYAPIEFQRTRDSIQSQMEIRKQRVDQLMAEYDRRADRAAKIGDLKMQMEAEKNLANLQGLRQRILQQEQLENQRLMNDADNKAAMERTRVQEAGANARAREATARATAVEEERTKRVVSRVTQSSIWTETSKLMEGVVRARLAGMDRNKKKFTANGKSAYVTSISNVKNSVTKTRPGETPEDHAIRVKLYNQWVSQQPESDMKDDVIAKALKPLTYEEVLRAQGVPENKIAEGVQKLEAAYGPATASPPSAGLLGE